MTLSRQQRVLVAIGAAGGACAIAIPAALALSHNPAFGQRIIPVHAPSSAHVIRFDNSGVVEAVHHHSDDPKPHQHGTPITSTVARSHEPEPGDDRGRSAEPGDDRGRGAEPGDDRGRGAEPGDDRGRGDESGDDRSATTSASDKPEPGDDRTTPAPSSSEPEPGDDHGGNRGPGDGTSSGNRGPGDGSGSGSGRGDDDGQHGGGDDGDSGHGDDGGHGGGDH